uniref:ribosomal protein S3 n=1 Tax=Cryptomonas pyrenoidifera TaxID=233184 RepID=UPI00226CE658|nr:ribosomal protein S3 [Cryptomonas pyrenoidifera]UZP15129.1 ribosomal protein S3 [Cryptomonas pyrenoidifera]
MSRKKNSSSLNITNNKTWNSSWCIYNQEEFRYLLQEDLVVYSYIRSQFKNFELMNIINLRIYRINDFLIIDLAATYISFTMRELITIFLNSLSIFLNKYVYVAINKLSYLISIKNAFNIALKIAKLIEKRIKFRSKIVKTLIKKVKDNTRGIYVQCTGRINNVDMARVDKLYLGSVPLQSIKAYIDYAFVVANTSKGLQSIKVWVCK